MITNENEVETITNTSSYPTLVKKIPSYLLYPITINILFIIGGLLFLSRILQEGQVLDIILAPVAIILTFFTTITKPIAIEKDIYNTLTFSMWIIASYVITVQTDSEILFILILVGFLIIQELSQEQITQRFQKRLNIVLVFFLFVFVVIVVDKIHIILTG